MAINIDPNMINLAIFDYHYTLRRRHLPWTNSTFHNKITAYKTANENFFGLLSSLKLQKIRVVKVAEEEEQNKEKVAF